MAGKRAATATMPERMSVDNDASSASYRHVVVAPSRRPVVAFGGKVDDVNEQGQVRGGRARALVLEQIQYSER